MNEKTLLKFALVCSIIGIFIIFIFADRLEPSLVKISEISESSIDKSIRVQGEIESIKSTPTALMLGIKDGNSSIKVVAFNDKNLAFNKGQPVEVFGIVTEYKGVLEIEAKSISTV